MTPRGLDFYLIHISHVDTLEPSRIRSPDIASAILFHVHIPTIYEIYVKIDVRYYILNRVDFL